MRRRSIRAMALVFVGAILLAPIAWTLLAAFGVVADNSTRPPAFTGRPSFDRFLDVGVAEPAFWEELATSTAAAVVATALATAVAFLAAYGLARSRVPGRRAVTQSFLVLASLPAIAYVIPLSDLMRRAQLGDSLLGLILAEAAITAPLAIYVLEGALARLPADAEAAAALDGAGLAHILWRVVLPAAAPQVGATAIVLFVLDWNLLLPPLLLSAGTLKTVPVAMSDFFTFERELDWPTAAAALVLSLTPLLAIVAALHRLLEAFALPAGGDGSAG